MKKRCILLVTAGMLAVGGWAQEVMNHNLEVA